ncbi:regulator of MON1-CCZ1 complex [Daphnia magna]|uniref:regulator of MON1-CCZ1 complex n=1 Tax=Daphnia magna TaxID=35525 RepID=UPI001E1BBF1B|nr:regulator of MON1-CCZ1 complex [Daphnia magna]
MEMSHTTIEATETNFLLQLSQTAIHFEPVTKITNVFYDEVTRQVFTVRSGGATGVNVKGPKMKNPINFCVEDKGAVQSIKFSPDQQILAIQRTSKSVEFQNFSNQVPDGVEYSQPCRGSSTIIIGFVWVSNTDFILVTNQGIEHYQVISDKRYLRAVKNHSIQGNWFVYCALSGLLLVSSGPLGTSLQPYLFKNHQLLRLTKFEVDFPNPPQPARLCLVERDVTPTVLYNQMMVLVLKHPIKPNPTSSREVTGKSEIVVYTLCKDSPPRKTHILQLETSGKLAVSILDNLIVVHHQASKTSSVFDINLTGESDGRVVTLHPFLASVTIRPYFLNIPASAAMLNHEPSKMSCELYSPNWVFFQPNIIIDALLGCLWSLELVLTPLIDMAENPCELFDFLLQRTDAKPTAMAVLSRLMCFPHSLSVDLPVLGRVFDKLNEAYRNQLDIEIQSQIAMPAGAFQLATGSTSRRPNMVIDQTNIYSRILSPMIENKPVGEACDRFIVAIVSEYIRSLVQYHIPVQHFIYEVLIEAFARLGQFYQLHQLFQYHAVADSKPLACLLLSLESVYPAAYQLAIDMLKRISNANEEIVEILLSKNKVLSALRFARDMIPIESISARKFLEAAQNSQDPSVFYGVYQYFQQRNQRARGSPAFLKGEHCEVYSRHFKLLFGDGDSNISLSDSLTMG